MEEQICTSCGSRRPGAVLDGDALLHVLRFASPHREVYRSVNGDWYVTHGGGLTSPEVVRSLVSRGLIKPVYSNTADTYHIGKTIDIDRTIAHREIHGRRAPLIYLEDRR